MDTASLSRAIPRLKKDCKKWKTPVVSHMGKEPLRPFQVLVGALISSRTQDAVTESAATRLFKKAADPRQMTSCSQKQLEKLIYPVAFYKTKSKVLHKLCADLVERFDGGVPDTLEGLLTLKGVGRKTANLTLTRGFGKMGICVDTHVHRICNRWGYVKTRTPDGTEQALREKLPKRYWKSLNEILVAFGQNCCRPVSPYCSQCKIAHQCQKVGITQSR